MKGDDALKGMKIGIDFGSYSLKIFAEGKEIVVDEPSIAAVEVQSGNPIAFGLAADNVYGRCGEDIEISKVIKNGIVSDFVMAERMLRYYLQRVCGNRIYKPNIVLSLPSDISNLEKKIFFDIVTLAGAGRVCLVDGILASAIGSGVSTDELDGRMVIDIGHNITEIAIISMGGIAAKGMIKRGSYDIDKAIINHLKRDRDILIGPHTAREIKNKIASAVDRECETALFVSGKSCLDNLPISFEVTSTEIFPYIDEQVNQIIKEIHNEILNVSPDLLADSADNGIILTGGGSLMFDLSKRLSEELDIRCEVVENPCLSKIKGLGILMSDEKLLSNNGYRFIFKDEIKNRK